MAHHTHSFSMKACIYQAPDHCVIPPLYTLTHGLLRLSLNHLLKLLSIHSLLITTPLHCGNERAKWFPCCVVCVGREACWFGQRKSSIAGSMSQLAVLKHRSSPVMIPQRRVVFDYTGCPKWVVTVVCEGSVALSIKRLCPPEQGAVKAIFFFPVFYKSAASVIIYSVIIRLYTYQLMDSTGYIPKLFPMRGKNCI